MSNELLRLLGDAAHHVDLTRPYDSVEQLLRLTRLLAQVRDFIADVCLEESSERICTSFDPHIVVRLWQTVEQVQKLALAQCFFHGAAPSGIEAFTEQFALQN